MFVFVVFIIVLHICFVNYFLQIFLHYFLIIYYLLNCVQLFKLFNIFKIICENPANLGFFLFVGVFVANQRWEVYWSDWIFDNKNRTSIQSHRNRNECIYDFYKDSIICWPINHEKIFIPLSQATDLTKSKSYYHREYMKIS